MVLLHVLGAILLGMSIILNPIVIIGIERTPVLLISKKLLPTRIMSYKPVLCHYLNDYRTTSSGFKMISGSENCWFQFFEKYQN
jgi:hypothetical protein